jgi:copper(I)-binding protein
MTETFHPPSSRARSADSIRDCSAHNGCRTAGGRGVVAHRGPGTARSAAWGLVLLACCGVGAVAQEPVLRISDAWVRAMPPGQRMTAAYLHIENTGDDTVLVEGVETSVGRASLHETLREGDRVRMQAKERLEIPAGESVVLAPRGLHVMLTELARTPAEGESIRLCVSGSAPTVCVDAPVLRRAPGHDESDGGGSHRHHDA